MKDEKMQIERGIAQGAHTSAPLTDMARRGLLDFLREQIVDAEWEIARAKATIEAYQKAIEAIERRTTEAVDDRESDAAGRGSA